MTKKPDYENIRRLERELGIDQPDENPILAANPLSFPVSAVDRSVVVDHWFGMKLRPVIYGPNGRPL